MVVAFEDSMTLSTKIIAVSGTYGECFCLDIFCLNRLINVKVLAVLFTNAKCFNFSSSTVDQK